MATYDLEEQEQLDELKTWWKMHGNKVTALLLSIALAASGWQGWHWYQRNQAAQASGIYGVLQQAASQRDLQRVKAATGELLERFGSSTYAPLAALIAAKAAHGSGDLKTARVQLSWALDHADNEIKDLVRLRLAAVLLDEKANDEALALLREPAAKSFAGLFADLRGDILLAQGKRSEAKLAYRSVLDSRETAGSEGKGVPSSGLKELVRQKLDALGDA